MIKGFASELEKKQEPIHEHCDSVAEQIRDEVMEKYGEEAFGPYIPLLNQYTSRESKRIRGILIGVGYRLVGGEESKADQIAHAGALMELFHAYILGIDDIQDRARTRHGLPVTHVALAEEYRGDYPEAADHIGLSLACNAIFSIQHFAAREWQWLKGFPEDRIKKTTTMINDCLVATASGQTYDVINAYRNQVLPEEIERVIRLKTSLYTITMPLQVGMLLGDASAGQLKMVEALGDALGMLFQLGDDRQTYESSNNGKDKDSDICEGKRTLIVAEMMKVANADQRLFISKTLGNENISPDDFTKFVELAHSLGAYAVVKEREFRENARALREIQVVSEIFDKSSLDFLRNMAGYFLERKT